LRGDEIPILSHLILHDLKGKTKRWRGIKMSPQPWSSK